MMMSTNAVSKMHIGHYTYYSKAVVRNEKNFYLAQDVYAQDYIKGDSTKIYSPKDLRNDLTEDKCGTKDQRADLIVIKITEAPVTNPIDIRGKAPECCDDQGRCFEAAGDGEAVRKLIEDNIDGQDPRTDRSEFQKQYHRANTICFKGACRVYDAVNDKEPARTQLSTGMWGPHGTYPGCASARSGGMTELCGSGSSRC